VVEHHQLRRAGQHLVGSHPRQQRLALARACDPQRAGSPLAALDHQAAFLRSWLGFVGIADIHPIDIRPTFAAAGDVERTMAAALAEADRLAGRLR